MIYFIEILTSFHMCKFLNIGYLNLSEQTAEECYLQLAEQDHKNGTFYRHRHDSFRLNCFLQKSIR